MARRAWRPGPPDYLGYDIEQDERWDSLFRDDHIIGSALPSHHRGIDARPARLSRRATSPMNALAGRMTGRDGRPASATSSTSVAASSAATDPAHVGRMPGPSLAEPGSGSSSPLPGREAPRNDVRRRGGHRDGA